MSTKVQRDWGSVCDELNAKLQGAGRDYRPLSKASGTSYYAVRRFILHGVKNRTEAAEKLCLYFGIELYETANVQSRKIEELTALVAEVWDGSGPHAELLAKLIKSTKPFRVQDRGK